MAFAIVVKARRDNRIVFSYQWATKPCNPSIREIVEGGQLFRYTNEIVEIVREMRDDLCQRKPTQCGQLIVEKSC